MKNRFQDPSLGRKIVNKIHELTPDHEVVFMHVCGTHEYTINHFGIRSTLPEKIRLIAGPGCPVCVVPAREIDEAIWLALNGVTVATLGDMYGVPGSEKSLSDAKAEGGDVRIVYSVLDAVRMAERERDKEFVFFAIGFETTAPTSAVGILNKPPDNFSLLVSHRLIPPVMELLMGIGDLYFDGFICPGHVATIIGEKPFRPFPEVYRMPTVIAGFEPLDVLMAVYILLRQLREGKARMENEYTRSVSEGGNLRAQRLTNRVFEVVSGHWRGIGRVPSSALKIKDDFSMYDARLKHEIKVKPARDIRPGCVCHLIMIGKLSPEECPLFMGECKPRSPMGPCMVSHEGTCNIWAKFGFRGNRGQK